jgi:hypothetical protein
MVELCTDVNANYKLERKVKKTAGWEKSIKKEKVRTGLWGHRRRRRRRRRWKEEGEKKTKEEEEKKETEEEREEE